MKKSLVAAAFFCCATLFASAAQADKLDGILAQMDAASAKFRNTQADFTQAIYERVVKDTTTDHGSVYFIRKGSGIEMGLKINPPDTRFVEYKNGIARMYSPSANTIDEIHGAQYESFLSLGFGGRGSDLKKAWEITDQGAEQMNDGASNVTVEKLDLVAKDPAARSNFSHITIWVDATRSLSLKQVFFLPGGNTRTTQYTNVRYNSKEVKTGPYEFNAKGATVTRH